jgi:hypothetical protein
MRLTKMILDLFALATVLALVFPFRRFLAFLMPAFEFLRQHILEVVVVLMVLLAMKAVSVVPRLRSR